MLRVFAKVTVADRLVSRVRISYIDWNTAVRHRPTTHVDPKSRQSSISILLLHVHGSSGRLQPCQIADQVRNIVIQS